MKYSGLSDFEINSAVHNALMVEPYQLHFQGNNVIRWVKDGSDITTEEVKYGKNTLKNYCNSWADAGPIIAENKISLVSDGSEWWADASASWIDGCEWSIDCCAVDANPLRAAMIAFLKSKE